MNYLAKNENQMKKIATVFAAKAKGGDIFALCGELGSGKTTFAKAFARALGVVGTVTSPTFVLLKEYKIKNKFLSLIHADCYRINSAAEAENIGFFEYFRRNDVIILIEWPEKISSILPARTKYLYFQHISKNSRKISYDAIY